jgi:high affinity sulfate transporter 1
VVLPEERLDLVSRLQRRLPGLTAVSEYRPGWLPKDLAAGAVLAALLVPAGMGYAEASGLPAIQGLYATIAALIAYALMGPSRVLILGPDSSLVPIVAATVIPLADGNDARAIAVAAALAGLAGIFCLIAGFAHLGFVTDLLSMPIRVGYLNGIALTLFIGQLPKLFGFTATGENLPGQLAGFWQGVEAGKVNTGALVLGLAALVTIVLMARLAPRFPGILLAVAGTMAGVAIFDLGEAGVALVGRLPSGLPAPSFPAISAGDLPALVGAALAVALITLADGSVLSRSLAARDGRRVDADQELVALGSANLLSGLFAGMPVSASNTRTPVAQAAGAKSPLAGLTGALLVAALLLLAPNALSTLPSTALAAVVISASFRLVELKALKTLSRTRRSELAICLATTAGVAILGAIEGIGLALVLAVLSFLWRSWRPHSAELVHVDGLEGFHDHDRHPEGRRIPGLVLFRFDAPLFFANADLFRRQVLALVEDEVPTARWMVVTAEPVTDVDSTAAVMLEELHRELNAKGISLRFAELKGTVRDGLARFGLVDQIGPDRFYRTIDEAVEAFRTEARPDSNER